MYNLNSNVLGVFPLNSSADGSSLSKDSGIPSKINGNNYLFDPSKKAPTLPLSQAQIAPIGRPGLVVQTFFQFRSEDPSIGNTEEATVYHIKLESAEALEPDSEEEELPENLDEESTDEPSEDLEDTAFSDTTPSMQEDFFNQEEFKDAFETMVSNEVVLDDRAKKMWQKAKEALLENLRKKQKNRYIRSKQFGAAYFSFLYKK